LAPDSSPANGPGAVVTVTVVERVVTVTVVEHALELLGVLQAVEHAVELRGHAVDLLRLLRADERQAAESQSCRSNVASLERIPGTSQSPHQRHQPLFESMAGEMKSTKQT
jgi:hypothetical protein